MTLADAIRKGAMQRAQCSWGLHREMKDGVIASCALGAAYEGLFGEQTTQEGESAAYATLVRHFPALKEMRAVFCPDCGGVNDLEGTITHLNDSEQWTREQIADWLDTLDAPSSTPDAAPPAERGEVGGAR